MGEYRQEAPFQVEIDLVHGCFMGCDFCALLGCENPTKYKFMKWVTFKAIIDGVADAGWKSRICIAGHGEPMLHPHILDAIRYTRKKLPDNVIHLVSNGYKISNETVHDLFSAGVTQLALSEYLKFPKMKKIKARLKKEFSVTDWEDGVKVKSNVDFKSPIVICKPFELETKDNKTHILINRCGQAFPPSQAKITKRCAKPFRDMFMYWDGRLGLCCNDFRECLNFPTVQEMSMDDLWHCEQIEAARRILYHDGRFIYPCCDCDFPAYRIGLLPDKKGKQEMACPKEGDYILLQDSIRDYPVNGYVPREWESEEFLKGDSEDE